MKRHASLIPLTHDHHHALAQARQLELAAAGPGDLRLTQAREFVRFFYADTVVHFREEEENLFPMVVEEDEAEHLLGRAMFDHLRIHALVHALREDVKRGAVSPESMTRLAKMLQHHIRLEEKVLFPMIERMVPDVLLREVSLESRGRAEREDATIGAQ